MLKPSRELDALIAEKVMGIEDDQPLGWSPEDYVPQEYLPYSTDIAAAWQVVEKLIGPYNVRLCSCGNVHWQCFIERAHEQHEGFSEDSAPHAICLAALKLKGVK